ncbi:hypothetical protein GCM10022245_27000 [Streptomyces mayteni]
MASHQGRNPATALPAPAAISTPLIAASAHGDRRHHRRPFVIVVASPPPAGTRPGAGPTTLAFTLLAELS